MSADRRQNIEKLRAAMAGIREKISQETLQKCRSALVSPPSDKAADTPSPDTKAVPIDRARNVAFVKAFLDSPAGAHLKKKLFP